MYQIKSTLKNGKVAYSQYFGSKWAVELAASSFIEHYEELEKTEIINRKNGKIEKTYKRG